MFCIQGKAISDQFYRLKLILCSLSLRVSQLLLEKKIVTGKKSFGNFAFEGGGRQNSDKMLTF